MERVFCVPENENLVVNLCFTSGSHRHWGGVVAWNTSDECNEAIHNVWSTEHTMSGKLSHSAENLYRGNEESSVIFIIRYGS